MLGGPHQSGHGVVEFVGDAGAELAEHREARPLNELGPRGTQVLQGGGQCLLLSLEVLGEHRILQVQVLGPHEAPGQGTDREGRQGGADGGVLGDDDL